MFGAPAAILAGISGAAGLADATNARWAAVLALVSAAFTSLVTTLGASRRAAAGQSAGNAYLEIQTAARQLLTIDLLRLDYDDARAQLQELTARRDEVNKTADVPSRLARRMAMGNLRGGGQDYEADVVQGSGAGGA